MYVCICCIPAEPGESVGCQSRPVMSHYVLLSLSLSTSFAPPQPKLVCICVQYYPATMTYNAGLLQCLLDIFLPLLDWAVQSGNEAKWMREWPAAHSPSQTLKHSQFHVHPSKKAGGALTRKLVRTKHKCSEQAHSKVRREVKKPAVTDRGEPQQFLDRG